MSARLTRSMNWIIENLEKAPMKRGRPSNSKSVGKLAHPAKESRGRGRPKKSTEAKKVVDDNDNVVIFSDDEFGKITKEEKSYKAATKRGRPPKSEKVEKVESLSKGRPVSGRPKKIADNDDESDTGSVVMFNDDEFGKIIDKHDACKTSGKRGRPPRERTAKSVEKAESPPKRQCNREEKKQFEKVADKSCEVQKKRGRPSKYQKIRREEDPDERKFIGIDGLDNNFNKKQKDDDEVTEVADSEQIPAVVFSEDEEFEKISMAIHSSGECVEPEQYSELETLWHAIVKGQNMKLVQLYYETLRKMLLGRVSSLTPIKTLVPNFPKEMQLAHNKFFKLITEMSGVYPHSYHNDTELISKHFIGGVNEIGAVSLLCCLLHGVSPLNLDENRPAITRISSIVRTQLKDSLEKAEQNLGDAEPRIVKISDIEVPKIDC